jgi:hypothetical protein
LLNASTSRNHLTHPHHPKFSEKEGEMHHFILIFRCCVAWFF